MYNIVDNKLFFYSSVIKDLKWLMNLKAIMLLILCENSKTFYF